MKGVYILKDTNKNEIIILSLFLVRDLHQHPNNNICFWVRETVYLCILLFCSNKNNYTKHMGKLMTDRKYHYEWKTVNTFFNTGFILEVEAFPCHCPLVWEKKDILSSQFQSSETYSTSLCISDMQTTTKKKWIIHFMWKINMIVFCIYMHIIHSSK